MLTFASDGEKIVKEICQIFRREREKYPSIGVLVLSEHLDIVNKDPHRFISGAFHQAWKIDQVSMKEPFEKY